ncbi:MAG: hypothetical protein B6I20_14095, partial [Bacteroidetes bacterium 4572_117]
MCLFQDSHNNIWIGTKFGAAKYNGESFKIYSPHTGTAAGDINFIFETIKGEILLCTVSGNITKIKDDSTTVYKGSKEYESYLFTQMHDSLISVARHTKNNIKSTLLSFNKGKYRKLKNLNGQWYNLVYANDTIWILYKNSLNQRIFAFLDKKYKFKELNINIPFIRLQSKADTIYLSTYKTIYKYFEGKLTKLIEDDSLWTIIPTKNGFVKKSFVKKNKITEYDYTSKQITTFNIPAFRNVITDKEGNLWFGTENGLYKLAEKAFKHYVFKDYNIDISNPGVVIDKNNNIWLSSFNGKLYKYNGNKFIDFTDKLPTVFFPFLIAGFVKPDGTIIWGRSGEGVVKKKGNKFTYAYKNLANIFEIYYDTLTQNTLYGHAKGVFFEDKNDKLVFDAGSIIKTMILAIEKDTAGYYWFASRREIFRYKNKKLTKINDSAFTYGALDIAHDAHNNLWFGGEGGLVFYDNKNFKKIEHPKLLNKAITALHVVGDSVLLIGTTSGMAAMDLKTF